MKPMFNDPGAVAMLTALGVPNDHRLTTLETHTGRMLTALWEPDTAKQAEGRQLRPTDADGMTVTIHDIGLDARSMTETIRDWCATKERPQGSLNLSDVAGWLLPPGYQVGADGLVTGVSFDGHILVDRLVVRTRQNVTYVVEQTVNGEDYQVLRAFRGRTGRKRARQWLRTLAWAPYVLTTINVDFHRNQPVDHIHINCTVVPKETTE